MLRRAPRRHRGGRDARGGPAMAAATAGDDDCGGAHAALLERCGGALPFLQATVGVSPAGQAYSVTRPR